MAQIKKAGIKYGSSFFLCFFFPAVFSVVIASEFSYDSHDKRDPFLVVEKTKTIVATEDGAITQLKLEGIVLDPKGRSVAIVNGEMVKEGDRIGDQIVVKRITKQGVEFDSKGKVISIPIAEKDE